jgi:hypothetical protein
MNTAAAIKIVKVGSKVARSAWRYVQDDLHHYYGLSSPAWASFKGDGVGILGRSLEVGVVAVGVLKIEFVSASLVRFSATAFAAALKIWNGPNVIPDNLRDGSFEMSLWHDLVWAYAKAIAAALGVSEQDVMAWADGILDSAYRGYGKKHGKDVRVRARIAFNVCEWSRRWWRKVFPGAVCLAVAVAMAAGCSGCATPPGWEMEEASPIEWTGGAE